MQHRRSITQAVDIERPVLESIVDFYNPSTNPHIYEGTPDDVVEKRANSKGYHNMRFFLRMEGRTQVDKIDEQSSIFGNHVKERWVAKIRSVRVNSHAVFATLLPFIFRTSGKHSHTKMLVANRRSPKPKS